MKFYIADAFTDELFGGNPAGVVILEENEDFPDDETMRKTAAELRYSETAFVKRLTNDGGSSGEILNDIDFHIRYFTPTGEVELCGHATIAAFICLLDADLAKSGSDYRFNTAAGKLTAKLSDGFVVMDMAPARILFVIREKADINELYDIMGIEYEPVLIRESCSSRIMLTPLKVSAGLPEIFMPVLSRSRLARVTPDFSRLVEYSKRHSIVGVHAFTIAPEESDIMAYCRNFCPACGIDEESATGTANGALTYYLYSYGIAHEDREYTFIQGEAMGRPSKIYTRIGKAYDADQNSDGGKRTLIQVGGSAKILAKGELYI